MLTQNALTSDVDIFFYGITLDQYLDYAREYEKRTGSQSIMADPNYGVARARNILFHPGLFLNLDFVYSGDWKTLDDVLDSFDISIAQVAMVEPGSLFGTSLAFNDIMRRQQTIIHHTSKTDDRAKKYESLGFKKPVEKDKWKFKLASKVWTF